MVYNYHHTCYELATGLIYPTLLRALYNRDDTRGGNKGKLERKAPALEEAWEKPGPLPSTKRTQQNIFGGLFDANYALIWSPEPENPNFLPSEVQTTVRCSFDARGASLGHITTGHRVRGGESNQKEIKNARILKVYTTDISPNSDAIKD